MVIEDQIKALFTTRDNAVSLKDKELFLSTQLGVITKSGVEGYLKTGKLSSTVLYLHKDEIEPMLWVALVKEDYYNKRKFSHQGYLWYTIVEKNGKVLISEIKW